MPLTYIDGFFEEKCNDFWKNFWNSQIIYIFSIKSQKRAGVHRSFGALCAINFLASGFLRVPFSFILSHGIY